MSDSIEISSAQYMADLFVWLSNAQSGALPAERIYELINERYGQHFSAADKRKYRLPNGKMRPKWMNAVDWAKAQGARQDILATVRYKRKNWVVLLDYASDEWLERARNKKTKRCFMKRCSQCKRWLPLAAKCCCCGIDFPEPNARRRVVAVLKSDVKATGD